jgi:hypothetical protein
LLIWSYFQIEQLTVGESEVSETQKHLICVSTVERLINDLETLVYV